MLRRHRAHAGADGQRDQPEPRAVHASVHGDGALSYPAPLPHDPIEPVAADVFMVRGSVNLNALMSTTRNMAIGRHAGELTPVNSVRLDAAEEKKLRGRGTVMRVLRLGPVWMKLMTPGGASLEEKFRRLLDTFGFATLLSAHGSLLRGGAHEAVRLAVDRAYRK